MAVFAVTWTRTLAMEETCADVGAVTTVPSIRVYVRLRVSMVSTIGCQDRVPSEAMA